MNTLTSQRGMTLPEILVALVISLILSLGAFEVYRSSRQTYALQEDQSAMQENARYLFNFLSRDLRLAGVIGCMQMRPKWDAKFDQRQEIPGTGFEQAQMDFEFGVRGYEAGELPVGLELADDSRKVPNSDALLVKVARGEGASVQSISGADITLRDLAGDFGDYIKTDSMAMISDCNRATLFNVLSYTEGTGVLKSKTAVPNYTTVDGAMVYPMEAITYFVGFDADSAGNPTVPALMWRVGSGAPEALLQGVENLQFMYRTSRNTDFQDATDIPPDDWDRVIAVRVGLVMRSESPHFNNLNGQDLTAVMKDVREEPFMRTTAPSTDSEAAERTVGTLIPESDLPTLETMKDPSAVGKRYFRRVYETTIRLRNFRPMDKGSSL